MKGLFHPLEVLLTAACVLLAMACVGASERLIGVDEEGFAAIQTDRGRYDLVRTAIEWQTVIGFTFTNPRPDPVYLANCGGSYAVVLEKRVAGRWVSAWGNITPACLSPAIEIGPGEAYRGGVYVSSGFPGSRYHPQFKFDDPQGIYRLVLDPLASFDPNAYPFGPPLPLAQRVSNSFEIRLAPP